MYGYVKKIKNDLPDDEIQPVGDIEVISDVHIRLTPTDESNDGDADKPKELH